MANTVETVVGAGMFENLVEALRASGLDELLSGTDIYTLLAPSDTAFGRLPEKTVDRLLEDLPRLRCVLRYHILPGRYVAADLAKTSSVKTLQGEDLEVNAEGGITIGGASVVDPDIETDNGVIHIIDRVLLLKRMKGE